MAIYIDALDAGELEALIFRAAGRRMEMSPEVTREPPNCVYPVIDPMWDVRPTDHGALLRIRHPGFGWLSFLIPLGETTNLVKYLNEIVTALQPAPDAS